MKTLIIGVVIFVLAMVVLMWVFREESADFIYKTTGVDFRDPATDPLRQRWHEELRAGKRWEQAITKVKALWRGHRVRRAYTKKLDASKKIQRYWKRNKHKFPVTFPVF